MTLPNDRTIPVAHERSQCRRARLREPSYAGDEFGLGSRAIEDDESEFIRNVILGPATVMVETSEVHPFVHQDGGQRCRVIRGQTFLEELTTDEDRRVR